jgi:hypothetical protein
VIDAPDVLDVADNVPQALPLHPAPERAHVTPLFAESLATVAITAWDWPSCTDAVVGDTLTAIAPVAGGGVVVWLPPPLEVVPAQPAINVTAIRTETGMDPSARPRVTSRVSRSSVTGLAGRKFFPVGMEAALFFGSRTP